MHIVLSKSQWLIDSSNQSEQTDKLTDRKTDKQTDKPTDKPTDGKTEEQNEFDFSEAGRLIVLNIDMNLKLFVVPADLKV